MQRVNWPPCPNVSFSLCGRSCFMAFTSHQLISLFVKRTAPLDKESFTHVVIHPLEKVPPFTRKNRIGCTSGDKMRFPSYINITCCKCPNRSSRKPVYTWLGQLVLRERQNQGRYLSLTCSTILYRENRHSVGF